MDSYNILKDSTIGSLARILPSLGMTCQPTQNPDRLASQRASQPASQRESYNRLPLHYEPIDYTNFISHFMVFCVIIPVETEREKKEFENERHDTIRKSKRGFR